MLWSKHLCERSTDLHVRAWIFPGHGVQECSREAGGGLCLGLCQNGRQLRHPPNPDVVGCSHEGDIGYGALQAPQKRGVSQMSRLKWAQKTVPSVAQTVRC